MKGTEIIQGDIRIHKGRIKEIDQKIDAGKKEDVVDLSGQYIYSGLINAHDHLEMNLYPKLGNPPYANYLEWAEDIYKPKTSPIKEVESVDINDRLLWGGLKNLISGVTTVIHHNPRKRILSQDKFPIRVPKDIAWAHSVGLGKDIVKSFPKNKIPFIIHAAEGIDSTAQQEIEKLKTIGILKSNTVLVHAVGAKSKEIELIQEAKASVIWCPASNQYMFNKSAAIDQMLPAFPVLLGTDSTLTGSATLLDEMKVAVESKLASQEKIYSMVSDHAAAIFQLEKPKIGLNSIADFFCLPIKSSSYVENIFDSTPSDVSMVMVDGDLKLKAMNIESNESPKYQTHIGSREKRVSVDVSKLKKKIIQKVPLEILSLNPLWSLIQ